MSDEFQWAGNAIAAGANRIDVDLNNFGAGTLSLRVVLLTPGCELGGSACTAWTSVGATLLPPSSGWADVSFSIQEADLTRVMGSDGYAASLANIERVIIRHDSGPPDPPNFSEIVAGTLGVDNVELPEPCSPRSGTRSRRSPSRRSRRRPSACARDVGDRGTEPHHAARRTARRPSDDTENRRGRPLELSIPRTGAVEICKNGAR